ncbi:hypothetical protein L596_025309 [Steinernema carpocapsae]|uniref:G-protein coupled receptors family 1 profile domain-containing protein n=1 Tax=Steinernema carpocapsae TaxID=34508 RepID=A0A4U5M7E4_STECR|nr:hypothetical protein L596_025309 [Steinernema carpocapsae]
MNIYFNSPEYNRLYSCDYLNKTQWREYAVQRPNVGLFCMAVGVIYLCTYVPCLIVMHKPEFFENSCFKLMFLHGCLDVMAVMVNSFIPGYFFIVGTTSCDFPDLQFFAGTMCVAIWCGQCLNCILLATNRCVDLLAPNLSILLFEGSRTFIFYVVVLSYMAFFVIFGKPNLHVALRPLCNSAF